MSLTCSLTSHSADSAHWALAPAGLATEQQILLAEMIETIETVETIEMIETIETRRPGDRGLACSCLR